MKEQTIYSVKAGRFNFDKTEKKVRVSKDKGLLSIFTNEENQNHISWVNQDLNIEEIDIIVFPFDAVFQKIHSQNNTYLLRFESNDDKYFFYLQEKIDGQDFVKKINDKIAFVAPEPMEVECEQSKSQPMDIQKPKQEIKKQQKEATNLDFITRLQNNLMAAKKLEPGITHLSKIITPEAISMLLNEMSTEEKQALIEYLPEEQKDVSHLASNIRSPQFQQAVDVLSDALNSENAIPLFMQLGLDQKYLQKNYGVHAFLKALEEWGSRQAQKKQ